MAEFRLLIDFATGDNWQLPIALYERFRNEHHRIKPSDEQTPIQAWMQSLSEDEKKHITKK